MTASGLPESKRRTRLEEWLENDLRFRFEDRIWGIDEEVALKWGVLQARAERKRRRLPVIDGLPVATAVSTERFW